MIIYYFIPYKISGIKDVVGLKISNVRALKNFSWRYVADKLSVNQSAYSDMENGKIAVSNDKRIENANIMKVSKEVIERFSDQMIFNEYSQPGFIETIYGNPTKKLMSCTML